jgi:hypothetical protein
MLDIQHYVDDHGEPPPDTAAPRAWRYEYAVAPGPVHTFYGTLAQLRTAAEGQHWLLLPGNPDEEGKEVRA